MLFKKHRALIENVEKTNDKLVEVNKKLDEIYWANIFNNSISGSKWLTYQSFNPGRWAAGYQMLYIIFRIYDTIKPKNILEFGLGESSKLLYQYHISNQDASYKIIEQDHNWLNFFSKSTFDVSSHTVLLDIEKRIIHGQEVNMYKGLISKLEKEKFDFVIVDGPWGSNNYSRYQIVELLENNLISEQFVILIDDFERIGEQETVVKLKELLNQKGIKYFEGVYSGIKQTYLICSENFKFVTSL